MSHDTELTEDELIQLKLLRDFETDALIDAGLLGKDEILSSPLDRELAFIHDELVLRISTGPLYPAGPVSWQVENYMLSRTAVIELRARLDGISETAKSVNNVHEWSKAQEDMSVVFEPIMEVLQLADETAKYVRQFREKHKSLTHASTPRTMRQIVPITTSSSVAQDLLGKTPEEICVGIQGCYRILHIEEVWRRDLTRAYQHKREMMRLLLLEKPLSSLRRYVPHGVKYSRRKEDLVDHLLRPRVTFHGTQRQYVPSIVRHGFLKPGAKDPGTGEAHRARCGSTYGAGIYSSPDSDFALSYSDSYLRSKRRPTRPGEYAGLKLVVCAVTMGRSAKVWREDGLRTQTNSLAGADSHVANHGLEYIVFDSAQIIPVLVIHIDWSEEHHVANFANLPNDPSQFVSSGKKMHPKLLSNEGLFSRGYSAPEGRGTSQSRQVSPLWLWARNWRQVCCGGGR